MSADTCLQILRDATGADGPGTVHETWGASVVVEIDGLLLKANGDRSTVAEVFLLRRLHEEGLPVPEVVATGTDRRVPGGAWFVMRRMPGTAFDASHADDRQRATAIETMAHWLALLADVRLPGWGWVGDGGCGTSPSWRAWLREQLDHHAVILDDMIPTGALAAGHVAVDAVPEPPRGSVLNGDLGLSHVLVDAAGRVVGLLDWAAAVVGDPVFDVATFSMGGPAGDPIHDVLQPPLLAACGVDPADPRVQLYRAINHLANATWSVANEVPSWTAPLCAEATRLLRTAAG